VDDIAVQVRGIRELEGALDRMRRDVDVATVAALKATQNLAKKSIRSQIRGRPRWDHRGKSSRTGDTVKLNLSPHHATKGGGPGRLTGTLTRGVGGVRRPRRTLAGFQGGVGVGGGVRNLYKKRIEGQYPYFKPGLRKAEPQMSAVWFKAWGRAVR
jgi:hypothetical protein